ncbi:helix-turn-helix domain-containing protein [Streptomyces sp. 110]|uniref:Helix-turn-helix domain-containing protein n=1 Tax=Streptomyces endocoffeicus TaxID=2898945 RepID=A0ABS1Q584_9ACTN|nr:helix-turn-helix domain-containing protein [Streptomyces endocoffeicus]MBL1119841.1 helix-turn-helix domain-containing protein [Streptomyces endocoffeicus]
MVAAHRLFDSLGPGVATTLVVGQSTDVTSLQLHGDPADRAVGDAIIIATGALGTESQLAVIAAAAEQRATGVVLRAPVGDQARQLAGESHLTLGVLADDVGWTEFISMTDALLHHVHAPSANIDDAHQRVFRLADAIAEQLRAPVTVEDIRNQVLAYSAFGETADDARMASILGRAVPDSVVAQLRATGTFRRMATSYEPFTVDIEDPSFLTRLVVPLRVGPELVGSIWVIHSGELTSRARHQLRDLSRSLSLLLIRLRAHDELSSRYTTERVREALRRPVDSSSSEALVLPAQHVRVAALRRLGDATPQDDLGLLRTVFRRQAWADPILADVEGMVFAILTDDDGPGSWSWARSLSSNGRIGPVGVSRPTSSVADLPVRKQEALEVLQTGEALGCVAASHEEIWAHLTIRRTHTVVSDAILSDLMALNGQSRDGAALADTLLTWLMNWGDYNRAAEALQLHPNTVRQRMRRIESLHEVNLSDPVQRLALTLILHTHLRGDSPPEAKPESALH